MTIYTAIFGLYDTPKKPLVITPGWEYIMFTDQDFASETWQVRKVELIENNATLTARYYKIMFHHHVKDEYSIWVDGSFIINCNLDNFMMGNFHSPFTAIAHPIRDCVYREADECIRQKRGDRKLIEKQIELYRNFIPKKSGLIQSGILIRKNCGVSQSMCQLWWDHICKYSTRDQISFSFVEYVYGTVNKTIFDYRTSKEFIFKKHLHDQPYRIN